MCVCVWRECVCRSTLVYFIFFVFVVFCVSVIAAAVVYLNSEIARAIPLWFPRSHIHIHASHITHICAYLYEHVHTALVCVCVCVRERNKNNVQISAVCPPASLLLAAAMILVIVRARVLNRGKFY